MSKVNLITEEIYNLGTDKQKAIVDAVRELGSYQRAANKVGLSSGSTAGKYVSSLLKKAAKHYGLVKGLPTMPLAEGNVLGKVTTTIEKDGQNSEYQSLMEALEDTANILDIKAPKVASPRLTNADL